MALQFFTDHCVPTSVIKRLQETGHTVFRLRDSIPIDSPDEAVIAHAQQLDAILVSLNGDFADIVTYPPSRAIRASSPFKSETILRSFPL